MAARIYKLPINLVTIVTIISGALLNEGKQCDLFIIKKRCVSYNIDGDVVICDVLNHRLNKLPFELQRNELKTIEGNLIKFIFQPCGEYIHI